MRVFGQQSDRLNKRAGNSKEKIHVGEEAHPKYPAESRARKVWLFKENRSNNSSDSVAYALIAENLNAKICSMLSVHLQRSIRLR